MKRVSSNTALIKPEYDVIVIGSGYGGSISASRLARAGKKVCLLERGLEILPGDYPDTEVEAAEQMQIDSAQGKIGSPTGLFNIHVNQEQSVVVGCGLGGTSLINASVSLEPKPDIFSQNCWPSEIKADVDTELKRGFELAKNMLQAKPYPVDYPLVKKLSAHHKSALFMQNEKDFYRPPINVNFEHKVNHVGVEQAACNNCGDCITGCNTGAKNTTLMNYLPDAFNHGADIFCAIGVRYLEKTHDGWLVYYQPLEQGREVFDAPPLFIKAKLVVLAAGALGSTEIMLRSQAKGLSVSKQLGHHFSGNGDVLGFAYNCDTAINGIGFGAKPEQDFSPIGPCITSIIDLRDAPQKDQKMVIEEGSIPSAIGSILPKVLEIAAKTIGQDTDNGFVDTFAEKMRVLQSKIQGPYQGAVKHTQTYLVMSHDDAQGAMYLEHDKLRISWPGLGKQSNFYNANNNLLKATKALGGTYVKNPLWSKLLDYSLVTVHPLGGCIIADSAEKGVINHKGQVFDSINGQSVYSDLYIADGASIPTSLAVNPLLTISALAERCCALIARDRGWVINYDLPSKSNRTLASGLLGIAFTETMRGFFSKIKTTQNTDNSLQSYTTAAKQGKQENSAISFTVQVRSDDLNQFIDSADHRATMTGTVFAPALCEHPLSVSQGVFNLFVIDPKSPDTKRMIYNMVLTSPTSEQYFFSAYKVIKQGNLTDVWPATTTLYAQLFEGTSADGKLIGKGVLHIEPIDFAKQITTMKAINAQNSEEKLTAIARFGQHFAGALWQSYAGIYYKQPLFNPTAPPRKKRPLRAPIPHVYWFKTQDGVDLKLTRFNASSNSTATLLPVMLVHGLGVSSQIFTTDTIDTNLTEYLCANDYDVWLLDFRVSIDLDCAQQPSNADQVAKYDFPSAIELIRKTTGCGSIQAVVHCYGATTFFMSMLQGLKHVSSIVCSQIATHLVIPPLTELKTGIHLPGFLDLLGVDKMSAYTDNTQNAFNTLFDKAVSVNALTQAQGQCSSSVCHRITFLYSSLFQHNQLNQQLHENLHELFAQANIESLKHLAMMCRKRKLVDVKGNDSYLGIDEQLNNLNLPICFISGEKNNCYLPKSTEITFDLLRDRFATQHYSRSVIKDYGHIDCIFGANAVKDVYPIILQHLQRINE